MHINILTVYLNELLIETKMSTISQLQKQAKQAPKFILSNGTIFIADRNFTDAYTTDNEAHALKFSVGYDDERMKSRAWSLSLGETFLVKYL